MLCAPAVIMMLLVAGFPIVYAFWLSLQRADLRFPDADEFVGLSRTTSTVLTSSTWWTGPRQHAVHHRHHGHARARARDADRAGDVPGDLRPHGRSAPRCSSPTARSRSWPRSRGGWRSTRRRASSTQLFGLDTPPLTTRGGLVLRDHHGRGLEDHAVHRAAAARRPRARAGRPLQGREDGRRERLAALLEDHAAADQAGADGRAAVPDARRVPDLRHGVHHHPRRQQHRDGVGPRLPAARSTGSTSGSGRRCRS